MVFVMPVATSYAYMPPSHSHDAHSIRHPHHPTVPTTHAPNASEHQVTPPPKQTKQSISEFFTAIIRILVEVLKTREAEIEALCFRLYELIVRTRLAKGIAGDGLTYMCICYPSAPPPYLRTRDPTLSFSGSQSVDSYLVMTTCSRNLSWAVMKRQPG